MFSTLDRRTGGRSGDAQGREVEVEGLGEARQGPPSPRSPVQVLGPQLLDPPPVVLDQAPAERVIAASPTVGVVLALVLTRRAAAAATRGRPPPTTRRAASVSRRVHLGLGKPASTNISRARSPSASARRARTRVSARRRATRPSRPVASVHRRGATLLRPTGRPALASSSATAASPATTRSAMDSEPWRAARPGRTRCPRTSTTRSPVPGARRPIATRARGGPSRHAARPCRRGTAAMTCSAASDAADARSSRARGSGRPHSAAVRCEKARLGGMATGRPRLARRGFAGSVRHAHPGSGARGRRAQPLRGHAELPAWAVLNGPGPSCDR